MIKDELKKFPPGCIGGEFEYKWDKYIQTDGRIVDRAKQLFYFEESRWISHRSLVFILKRRGISFKEWYDYHYLPRDENGEYIYPKCKYCKNISKWSEYDKRYLCYCKDCRSSYMSEIASNAAKIQAKKNGNDRCSRDYMVARYGEETGLKKWNEWRNKISRSRTLDGLIDKFGTEIGPKKYDEICESDRYSHSLNGYIDKYGLEEGTKRYLSMKNHISMLRTDPNYCIELNGDDSKFINLYNTSVKNLSNVKSYSEISKKLFDSIIERIYLLSDDISEDVYYGDKEWKIPNTWKVGDIKRFRIPDFFIRSKSIIFEFQGDYWHKRPSSPEFNLSELTPEMEGNIKSDFYKLQSYRRLGYNAFLIHEYEYRLNPDVVIEECIKFITNESFRNEYTEILDSILNIKYAGPLNEERMD